jgi:hypothetical protein
MNYVSFFCSSLVGLAVMISISKATTAGETVLFTDSFSDVKGHLIGQTDGKVIKGGEAATRQVLPFMGVSPLANGKLTISAYEDPQTLGPDGKPGVLAISLVEVPRIATYSGFAYLGGRNPDSALTLKELTSAPTLQNLGQVKLRFAFKAANDKDPAAVGATFACRLEPLVNKSYPARLGFGPIEAKSEWQIFERQLAEGENIAAFLKSIMDENPAAYKLIWSQNGSITRYQAGDTLLIDDIQIVRTGP